MTSRKTRPSEIEQAFATIESSSSFEAMEVALGTLEVQAAFESSSTTRVVDLERMKRAQQMVRRKMTSELRKRLAEHKALNDELAADLRDSQARLRELRKQSTQNGAIPSIDKEMDFSAIAKVHAAVSATLSANERTVAQLQQELYFQNADEAAQLTAAQVIIVPAKAPKLPARTDS